MKNCKRFKSGLCVSIVNPQPLENFYEARSMKDGRLNVCKKCLCTLGHEKRLVIGGGKLKPVYRRPKPAPVKEKSCSKTKTGQCISPTNPQPIENFRPQKGRVNGSSICKSCEQKYTEDHRAEAIARSKRWARKNVEKRRHFLVRKNYGLDSERYAELQNFQGNKCAICNRKWPEEIKEICVDHDHRTGKVRGLLCHNCNRALGHFSDDTERMEKAIQYTKAGGVWRLTTPR